jgi:hypothetical protein
MDKRPTLNDFSPESNRRSNHIARAGAILLILICAIWLAVRPRDTRPHLPDAAEVRSIEASYYNREQNAQVEFQVPREHWNSIFSGLRPAQRVVDPDKWPGLGRLELKLVNGESYFISLYNPSHLSGAFSAGPTWDSRTYYQGGNSSDLEQALAEAFKSTEGRPESATQ